MGFDKMIVDVLSGKYNNTIENTEEYKEEYQVNDEKLGKQFKEDLFKAYNIEENYEHNCMYAAAYRNGKFEGYYGVLICFNKMISKVPFPITDTIIGMEENN